jgi:putative transposase
MNRKAYPTDLKDAEWELLEALLPQAKPGGRPGRVDLREILNAIFDRERTGCAWEMLPPDRAPAQTVYACFNQWSADGTGERINGVRVRRLGQAEGRDPEPSAASLDRQSVKTTEKGANGALMRPSQ